MLPFKTFKATEIKVYSVADDQGNVLEVPMLGWVTWRENEEFSQYTVMAAEDPMLSMNKYETDIVLIFLRIRFNIPGSVSAEEILQYPNGQSFSQSMIDALAEFFRNERKRWKDEKAIASANTNQDPKP